MLRLRYLSSQVIVSQCPWPPSGHFATSNSASWLLDCEASRKPFFPRLLLSFFSPHLLNFLLPTASPGAIIQLPIGEELWTPPIHLPSLPSNPHPTSSLPFTLSHFSKLISALLLSIFIVCAGKTHWEMQLSHFLKKCLKKGEKPKHFQLSWVSIWQMILTNLYNGGLPRKLSCRVKVRHYEASLKTTTTCSVPYLTGSTWDDELCDWIVPFTLCI